MAIKRLDVSDSQFYYLKFTLVPVLFNCVFMQIMENKSSEGMAMHTCMNQESVYRHSPVD